MGVQRDFLAILFKHIFAVYICDLEPGMVPCDKKLLGLEVM